jgi:hypothetical protein
MAKQTFTTGQVLTAAQMTSLQQTAMLGGNATAKTISYTLVAADAGTTVAMSNAGATTITVNTSLFAAGDIVTIYNQGAGVCTITAGTATVNTSGSLVLAQYQGGVLYFISASAAVFFQFATPSSPGDITGVTAGVGISGGGTSGDVTVTNSMATAMTTSGDLIQATGSGTFARLGTGTNGQYLTTNGTTNSWATPTSGGMTLISTTTLTGASITLSSIPSTYNNLQVVIQNFRPSVDASQMRVRINGITTGNYAGQGNLSGTGGYSATQINLEVALQDNGTSTAIYVIDIPNYANAVTNKFLTANMLLNNETTPANYNWGIKFGFTNLTTAISSLTFFPDTGSFTSGTVLLYGVK